MTKKENKTIDEMMQTYIDSIEMYCNVGCDSDENIKPMLLKIATILLFLSESGNREQFEYYKSMTDDYFNKYWNE